MKFQRFLVVPACAVSMAFYPLAVSAAPLPDSLAPSRPTPELIDLHIDIAQINAATTRRASSSLQEASPPSLTGAVQGPPLADAQDYRPPSRGERWKMPTDLVVMEIAYQAASAVDAYQSIHCIKSDYCEERNPIFGRNASPAKIVGFKVATGALHYFAIRELAKQSKTLARIASIITLAGQGYVVGYNATQHF